MKKISVTLVLLAAVLAGCDSAEKKAQQQAAHLASLTCDSPREGRTLEELQVIGDACFRGGSFHKSSGKNW